MPAKRATVRDLRRHNRSALLSTLYFEGPLSRQELVARTGLSAATVSTATAGLVDERLVVGAGTVESDGGRPRSLLRVNPGYGHVVGVDVGETGVAVELFDLALRRIAALDHDLPPTDPLAVGALIAAAVPEVIALAGADQGSVLGVGIGVPGEVERRGGAWGAATLVHAQTLGWSGVPLAELVRAGGTTLPLFVENGAKTQGQAEMWFGAGRGSRHVVVALLASGVGAAVVADGAVQRGSTSSAGEWGHTTVVHGGRRCRCGAHGCLEAYVGAGAVLERYRGLGGELGEGDERAAFAELVALAGGGTLGGGSPPAGGAQLATRVLEEAVGYLGAGIATLVNLFNPELIVLGGWAGAALGEGWLPSIVAATREHALRHPFARVRLEAGRLGPDAVAVGAATLPVAALLERAADPRAPVRGRAAHLA
ncbi:ROK family transcriptional regulator [Actinosynnema pretiosum subsp. pretiosum]|nr:ROK family transcriptional regulator [Actinosynnema mirum]QUF07876.1 ROK family transcriptional regulator [Actinosynnema pretiosum subsp. pretiosum]